MASEVHSDVSLRLSKGQHRAVFRNPRGNKRYYSFYYDSDIPALQYEWSVDGADWTNAPVAAMNGFPACFDVKIRDDGSQLVVYLAARTSTVIRYRRGIIADANNTITWGSLRTIKTGMTNELAGLHCIAIARTDNGRIVVAFTEDLTDMGKDYRLTKLIGSDDDSAAPAWSGETISDDPSGNSNNQDKDEVWFGLENFSSSYPNRVLIVARCPYLTDATTYVVKSAVPDWNGVAFNNATLGICSQSDGAVTGNVLSLLIDESDKAYALFVDDDNNDYLSYRKSASAGAHDWGAIGGVKAADVDACTLTLDTNPSPDELYAFYHDSVDAVNFHYKTSPVDVIVWGAEQTITFNSDLIALTSWNRDIECGLHIGIEDADTDV